MSTIDLPDGLPDFGAMAAGKAAATVGLTSGSGRGHFPNLNPQQQQIVAAPTKGVVQSIAGAGCGKTTGALLPRAQQLYRSNPGLIYILAFNTSVKEELESKIDKLLDPAAAAKIKPKTIAGLARGLVLNNLHHLGLPRDSALITADWVIIKFLKEQMEVQSSIPVTQRMPHFQPVFNSFRDNVIKALFDAEEKATAQGRPVEEVAKEYDDLRTIDPLYIKSFIFWNRAIRLASGKLMWRDLVPLASHLPAECYENLHVKHVLIDEAQDLSVEQHGMIKKLVDAAESATFVGDPSQCIYKWNGARPDLFLGIPKQYPGTQVFYMEINYRSDQPILDLANHVLRHLNSPINLKTPFPRNGEPVRTMRADKDELVKGVQELLENGVNPDDIAVLARINAHMLDLEVAFSNAGIPYQCWSGSFFEHAAVNDMLSYFRVLRADLDPQQCVMEDDWETVVGHTKFLGAKTIEETWLRSSGDPLADVSVPGACRSANQRKLWHDMINNLDRLKRVYGHMPHAFAMDVFKRLESVWADRWADDPSKKREAGEVAAALLDWISKYMTMEDLFAGLLTLSRKGSTGVVLSTVHKAKGMEWDYVFLWKVGKGFPQTYAWSDPEEEACIFYVGATRARHILTLCYESYPQEIPYGLEQALCPAQYVVTESLPSATPGSLDSGKATWGMYNVCQRCPRQLECLVGSQAS